MLSRQPKAIFSDRMIAVVQIKCHAFWTLCMFIIVKVDKQNVSGLSELPRKGVSFCSASFEVLLATYKYEVSKRYLPLLPSFLFNFLSLRWNSL